MLTGDGAGFAKLLRRQSPRLSARAETAADAAFLARLFVACSPLSGRLPDALLRIQARAQQLGYWASFPAAARIIVTMDDRPIGRIMIARMPAWSLAVDVAVLPNERGGGVGLAMLRAWVKIAEGEGLPCRLRVLKDNRVAGLYRRLGFRVVAEEEDDLSWVMQRPPAARP